MSTNAPASRPYKTWRCLACGYIYDEAEGWPEDGIAPGTRWEDIPAGWCCPECGARAGEVRRQRMAEPGLCDRLPAAVAAAF